MPARPKNTTVTLGVNTTLVNFIPKEECGNVPVKYRCCPLIARLNLIVGLLHLM